MQGNICQHILKKSPDGWAAVETCCFIVCYAPHLSQFDLVACTFSIAGSQEGDLASLEAVLRTLPGMLERKGIFDGKISVQAFG